mgnify:CR=1 FL=1
MGSKSAKRYARALFDLCLETQCLDTVHQDLAALQRLGQESPEFASFMDDPMIPAEKRGAVLDQILSGQANPATSQFLHFLEEKGRLRVLPEITTLFEGLVHEHHGILKITIHTASPLEAEQLEQIKRRMQARFEKQIEASVKIDPALVGGFKVRVGDTIHDYSIATQLEVLKRDLITT